MMDDTVPQLQSQPHQVPSVLGDSSSLQGMSFATNALSLNTDIALLSPPAVAPAATPHSFREIQVKVHIRRPDRDSWMYLGRGLVTQEVTGHSSRVGSLKLFALHIRVYSRFVSISSPVVRTASTGKVMAIFSEVSRESFPFFCVVLNERTSRVPTYKQKREETSW